MISKVKKKGKGGGEKKVKEKRTMVVCHNQEFRMRIVRKEK